MGRTMPALCVIACGLALAGCTSAATSASQPETEVHVHPAGVPQIDPIAAARALDDAPDAVSAQATCGEFELDQGEELPAEAIACIDDARVTGEAAALAWATPTTEGDPIVFFAVIDARASSIALHSTTHFDPFGTPGWSVDRCDEIAVWRCR